MCLPTPLKHTFCFVSAHLSVALLGHQPLKRLLCPLHPASAASITQTLQLRVLPLGRGPGCAILSDTMRIGEARDHVRYDCCPG